MARQPQVQPIDKEEAPPEVRARLDEIQDVMGLPWSPDNWRAYARYPEMLRLFWEQLRPATERDRFLRDALGIAERAYRDVSGWYQPEYTPRLAREDREQLAWELDAFEFGAPQLLIQQAVLSRALRGEVVGRGTGGERRRPSAYRQPEIRLVNERSAPEPVKRLYQEIKRTLGLPLVSAECRALAKWPELLQSAWEDVKRWRERPEYRSLRLELAWLGDEAAARVRPAVRLDEPALRAATGSSAALENLRLMVALFTDLLPELIVAGALFRAGIGGSPPQRLPRSEDSCTPGCSPPGDAA